MYKEQHTINWLIKQEDRIIRALADGDLDDARELFSKYRKIRNEMLDTLVKILDKLYQQTKDNG